jgi:CTP:molybdopterin cytidylyltransferase MocA
MSPMAPQVTVLPGGAAPASPPRTQLRIAYEHFRLERQGDLVSEKTLETHETHVEPFLAWVGESACAASPISTSARSGATRAREATRIGKHGRQLRPHTVLDSHKALLTFLRWCRTEGYGGRGSWLPPVLLDRSLWPEVMSLDGHAGARQLFEDRPELLDTVPADGRPDDVDTPDDYARIVHLYPRPNQG